MARTRIQSAYEERKRELAKPIEKKTFGHLEDAVKVFELPMASDPPQTNWDDIVNAFNQVNTLSNTKRELDERKLEEEKQAYVDTLASFVVSDNETTNDDEWCNDVQVSFDKTSLVIKFPQRSTPYSVLTTDAARLHTFSRVIVRLLKDLDNVC